MKIKQVIVTLTASISPREVTLFRGAVNAVLEQKSVLFHNHTSEGLRYSYPLVQYKRIGGKAALVCLGEGTEALQHYLQAETMQMRLGERNIDAELCDVRAEQPELELTETPVRYEITDWLPFNGQNYRQYRQSESMVERIQMLERILTGNILTLAKGLGYTVEEKLVVTIADVPQPHTVMHKGIKLVAFDIRFSVNMLLPQYVGLGKNVSHGNGTVQRVKR